MTKIIKSRYDALISVSFQSLKDAFSQILLFILLNSCEILTFSCRNVMLLHNRNTQLII